MSSIRNSIENSHLPGFCDIAAHAQETRCPFWMGSLLPLRMTLTVSLIQRRVSLIDWSYHFLLFHCSSGIKHIMFSFDCRRYNIFWPNPHCGERCSLRCSVAKMWSHLYRESKHARAWSWCNRKQSKLWVWSIVAQLLILLKCPHFL